MRENAGFFGPLGSTHWRCVNIVGLDPRVHDALSRTHQDLVYAKRCLMDCRVPCPAMTRVEDSDAGPHPSSRRPGRRLSGTTGGGSAAMVFALLNLSFAYRTKVEHVSITWYSFAFGNSDTQPFPLSKRGSTELDAAEGHARDDSQRQSDQSLRWGDRTSAG